MNIAAIDIGATSFQILILDAQGKILVDENREVGLGIGKGRAGMLPPERIQDGIHALGELVELARLHAIPSWQISAVATSALRRAFNAQSVVKKIQDQLGLQTRILSSDEESRYAWQGSICGLSLPKGPIAVIDLGGGSLEAVIGTRKEILNAHSFRLGCIHLTEEYFGTQPKRYNMQQVARMRGHIQETLSKHKWPQRPRSLIAVGNAATALASMESGERKNSPTSTHGTKLSRGMLRKWMDRILEASPSQRKNLCPAFPYMIDFLLVSACLLESSCTSFMRDSLFVSSGGVRLGVLLERFHHSPKEQKR